MVRSPGPPRNKQFQPVLRSGSASLSSKSVSERMGMRPKHPVAPPGESLVGGDAALSRFQDLNLLQVRRARGTRVLGIHGDT